MNHPTQLIHANTKANKQQGENEKKNALKEDKCNAARKPSLDAVR
jgi:hypothetical protein